MTSIMAAGRVDLIGCGPGDPDLLTVKAVRRIAAADVIVRDRLVGDEVVALARGDADIIDVGKTPYQPSISQDDINRILVREALKGRCVARLKGGDPGIFGRMAEEIAALKAHDILVEIIPGVTAAHACAAGILLPVTLRGEVRQFSVLTAATAEGEAELDWTALARPGQAFAIYMGVARAGVAAERLLAAGASSDVPVVIVENGTLINERAVATTVGHMKSAVRTLEISGPAVIFVGLDWQSAGLSRPRDVEVFAPVIAGTVAGEVRRDDNLVGDAASIDRLDRLES